MNLLRDAWNEFNVWFERYTCPDTPASKRCDEPNSLYRDAIYYGQMASHDNADADTGIQCSDMSEHPWHYH